MSNLIWQDTGEQCIVNEPNPVHRHKDGSWWFCDEVWYEEKGPYLTRELCNAACKEYAEEL